MAEPQAPSERPKAVRALIEDYEALWLSRVLSEHAAYGEHEHDDEADIARAYVDYIDTKVRDRGSGYIYLYAHTSEAIETIMSALLTERADRHDDPDFPMTIYRSLEESFADAFISNVLDEDDE